MNPHPMPLTANSAPKRDSDKHPGVSTRGSYPAKRWRPPKGRLNQPKPAALRTFQTYLPLVAVK
jgi:hypothetical protein